MAGDGASSGTRELDQTPTWAVASVCAGLIIISIVLEKGLHKIGHDADELQNTGVEP